MAFDIRSHLKNTKTTRPSAPFVGPGNHVLALLQFRKSSSQDAGTVYAVDFSVVKSDSEQHPADSMCSAVFKVERRPDYASQDSDADRLVALIQNMLGTTDTVLDRDLSYSDGSRMVTIPAGTKLTALEVAQIEAGKMLDDAGLAAGKGRGLLVRAYGAPPKKTKKGKDFVNVTYTHEPGQTKESIAARRRQLDQIHPRAESDTAAPAQTAPSTPATGGSSLLADL